MIQGEMKTSFEGLVKLLARNLYSEDDAFIRELIQNAHDSIVKRTVQYSGRPAGVIEIKIDRQQKTITFEDNGAGMMQYELEEYLSTIGKSGTGELRASLAEGNRAIAQQLIGQFGIGIMSAFVVAKKLIIETRAASEDGKCLRWVNEGSQRYTIEECDKPTPGTRIIVHLDEGKLYLANPDKIRESVRRYADFIPQRILVQGEQANIMDAPWHRVFPSSRDRDAAYRDFVNRRFPDYPLEIIPVDIDKPHTVQGVLYISDRRIPDINMAGMVDIYQARMFVVAADRNLLPEWARFVRGVIDSPDLTPTAARDAIQRDQVHADIQAALGDLIIQRLHKLATSDRPRFERLMEWHHYHLKGMAVRFDDFFDAVADLMLFECNEKEDVADHLIHHARNKLISIKDYVERQKADGKLEDERAIIYYFKEGGATTQFYRLCEAKGLLVLSACAVFEEGFLKKYADHKSREVILKRVDIVEGSEIFEPLPDEERRKFLDLEFFMATGLRAAIPTQETTVTTERFAPGDIPAVLTQTREHEVQEQLEQLTKHASLLGAFGSIGERALELQRHRIQPIHLHLNADNKLVQRLAEADLNNPIVRQIVSGLYNNALIYSMHALSAEATEIVYQQFNKTLSNLLDQQEQLLLLEAKLKAEKESRDTSAQRPKLEKTLHVSLFVMMPFGSKYNVLEAALRLALETPPFCFQVILARDETIRPELLPNVQAHMQQVHGFIAEISDENPNVMFELGAVLAIEDPRPKILLKQKGGKSAPVDFRHRLYLEYELPDENTEALVKKCVEDLSKKLQANREVMKLRQEVSVRFLSPIFLRQIPARLDPDEAERISRAFGTIEALSQATTDEVDKRAGLTKGFGAVVKAQVQEALAQSQE